VSEKSRPVSLRVEAGLYEQAAAMAAVIGKSFRALVEEGLRKELDRLRRQGPPELEQALVAIQAYRERGEMAQA